MRDLSAVAANLTVWHYLYLTVYLKALWLAVMLLMLRRQKRKLL